MKKSSLSFKTRPVGRHLEINFWGIIWAFLWGGMIFLLVARIVWFQQVSVVGASMEPNYSTDQLLFVDQLDKNFTRGRVVAVYNDKMIAKDANYLTRFQPGVRFLLKRIIGLPGEEIEIIGSDVIIYNEDYPDGVILEEEYVADSVKKRMEANNFTFARQAIPQGEYFVMGDNRTNSTDSRSMGSFPEYAILGQEKFRLWPYETAHWWTTVQPEYTFTEIE